MIIFTVKREGWIAGLPKRQFNALLKKAFRVVGVFWHANYRKKHFTKAGATEYVYDPRSGESGRPSKMGFGKSYTGKKLEDVGHTKPLVHSGESQRMTRLRDVRPTSKRVRIVLRAPNLTREHSSNRIHMRTEMTTISNKEGKHLAVLFGRTLRGLLKKIKKKKTTRMSRAA